MIVFDFFDFSPKVLEKYAADIRIFAEFLNATIFLKTFLVVPQIKIVDVAIARFYQNIHGKIVTHPPILSKSFGCSISRWSGEMYTENFYGDLVSTPLDNEREIWYYDFSENEDGT